MCSFFMKITIVEICVLHYQKFPTIRLSVVTLQYLYCFLQYLGTSNRHVTQFLEEAMMLGLPDLYGSRLLLHRQELSDLERAPDVPVFVCTTAFPSVPCPLFIYEPRYRLMVRRCVESGSRQFAIVACLEQGKNCKR